MGLNLSIKRPGEILGTVKLKDGTSHQNIDVYIPGSITITQTDVNGNYVLLNVPAGEYQLKFSKADYKDIICSNIIVNSNQNTPVPPLILKKNQEAALYGTITGKITDGRNFLAGALILIYGNEHITITDSDGNYCLGNILPGQYKLQIYKQGFKTKTLDIMVTAGKTTTINDISLVKGI